jgi:nickel superoxide dismutase
MQNLSKMLLIVVLVLSFTVSGYSHCQVPCGIYGDKVRIVMLKEHLTTIEKSMNQINELSKNPQANMNQLVRWVNNKDTHADEFTKIVTYYFLTQRIKIKDATNTEEFKKYQDQTTTLHQMMVYSMKSKQTADVQNVEKLRNLVDQFVKLYFSEEDQKHLNEHHK